MVKVTVASSHWQRRPTGRTPMTRRLCRPLYLCRRHSGDNNTVSLVIDSTRVTANDEPMCDDSILNRDTQSPLVCFRACWTPPRVTAPMFSCTACASYWKKSSQTAVKTLLWGQRAKSCCSVSLQRQVRRVVIVCTARTARNRVQADWDPTSLSVQNPKFVFGSPSLPESPYFSWLAALPRAA